MSYHIRVRACALIIENDAVLLVEFEDENGLHYNLPAGGAEPGKSIMEAVQREAREEASIEVEVGQLAFVTEYAPHLCAYMHGDAPHGLGMIFECKIKEGSSPSFPSNPDLNQTGVKWIPLSELDNIVLYPNMKQQIRDYAKHKAARTEFIEVYKLPLNQ